MITESEKLDHELDSIDVDGNNLEDLNPLNKIFFGKLNSTIKCLKCNENNTLTTETFSTLGLSIPIEYKLFVYFIPLKPGPASKMFIKITDNMYFKSVIEKVSKMVNYEIKSGIFYSVLKDELMRIFDLKERVVEIINKNSFLFLMEKDNEKTIIHIFNSINVHWCNLCSNGCRHQESTRKTAH